MKLAEVGYHKETIDHLMKHPIARENIKNIEKDFELSYANILTTELDENVTSEDAIRMKSDIFSAFCNGVLSSASTTSQFRTKFVLPEEYDPQKQAKKIIY